MDLPIYELKIQEELDDNAEVSFIALVDKPAIKKDFVVFSNEEFIEPSKGERKDKFLPRCISYVINEGKESEQAVAICNSIWEQHFAEDSYNDYPESAKNAAERGIKLNEKLGNKCATQVGKVRAQQIMNGEALSKETIKRTYSYLSRAAAYYNPDDTEACGTISYLLWGGESMLRWCESKMNNEDFKSLNLAFAIQDEDKHIISGPLMLADTPIYRNNSKFGEHYVKFSPETIKDIAIKFSKKGYQQNVNLMHDSNMQLDGLVMFESFIVDKERGIMPMAGFEDAKDGSWFGSFYVENEQAWKLIKEGKVKGFSVEGFFDYALPENRQKSYAEQKLAELADLLKVPILQK
jgi:hypothetical protein